MNTKDVVELAIMGNVNEAFALALGNPSAVQESGGHMLVYIDKGGYIYQVDENDTRGPMVHRETRRMHESPACCNNYIQARDFLATLDVRGERDCYGILELTPEGGGQAIFVHESWADEWDSRLKFWKGCYGKWPLHVIPGV